MYSDAHNTNPFSDLKLSPYQIVFHSHSNIPLIFDLNLTRDSQQNCTSSYCSHLNKHSHYNLEDTNLFLVPRASEPISKWFLNMETTMLQIYSKVHRHINRKLASSTSIPESEQKQLPVGSYVIHKNCKPVHFSDKLKDLRVGPFKITGHPSIVTYELLAKDGQTFSTHRNHLIPFYPKEPFILQTSQPFFTKSSRYIKLSTYSIR